MRLQIDEIPSIEETEIIIRCNKIDSKINRISNYIRTSYITINGKLDGENHIINLSDIYYFEAVENRVFAYVEKNVYEVNYKLQELTVMLAKTSFLQVARTIILNILLSTISQFVYEDMRFVRELIISLIGSLVTSMVLYFILKINVIPVLVQVLVVYLILAINILTVGYFTYIYDFYYNSKLVIATLITLAIGLGIIILLFYFLQRRSNKSLNDNLKHFKERDRDEETR